MGTVPTSLPTTADSGKWWNRGGLNGSHITFNYVIKYDIIYDNYIVQDIYTMSIAIIIRK